MSTTVRRLLRTAVACGMGVALAATALQAPAAAAPQEFAPPAEDPFYTPPRPLPAGSPGDIIRSRESVFTIDPFSRNPVEGVTSTQVLYRSEDVHGDPIAVSGTVLVPQEEWDGQGERPLVTYGVGTRGLGDSCAPSYTMTQGLDYEMFFIADALNKGWAVAVTDMQGLGTPGLHTYEVGKAQGMAALNMARAAQRLPGADLDGNPVAAMGYSQGGTTAGWAAELAASYAPELDLKGVVAGGVPADLRAVAANLDGNLFAAFMFMSAAGYDAAYPQLDLESFLNDAGRELMETSADVCIASVDGIATFGETAFKKVGAFTTSDPLATPQWQAKLDENKLGSTAPTVPVLQTQAVFDQIIPFEQADALHRAWCAKGANVTWKTYTIAEHATGMVWTWPDAIDFLTDRFAGEPAQGNCAA
ncbi:triacylglycerol lipase [Actinomadura sp. CNU-125]|uniref:lipase family protein n=1 Tax=Actinomadura sp. CNU-125 TaxID=1904961 RepID=UPI00095E7755|nr:lipase family protein [Actinomadura sp. CNU-125]OLT27845.1 triacylglycerol lipase [Actinomadura sp. CNU-125]